MSTMRRLALLTAVLALTGAPLAAQREGQPPVQGRPEMAQQRREMRDRMRERWEKMSPDERARFLERREKREERRFGQMPPEQRQEWVRTMQEERNRLRAQVDSGNMTPEQARTQMREWMHRTLPAPDTPPGPRGTRAD